MSFVREKIPDADRERFKIPIERRNWLADRKNELFLINKGTKRDHDTYFDFIYGRQKCEIWGYKRPLSDIKPGGSIEYDIRSFWIPPELKSKRSLVISKFIEAMQIYCFAGRRIDDYDVRIKLPADIEVEKE